MLLIIDNQSSYIKRFKQDVLIEYDIPYVVVDHNEPIDFSKTQQVCGVILSGGKGNPFTPLNLTADFLALAHFDVPTIGFCLGHEVIAVHYKARIKRLKQAQRRVSTIELTTPDDPLFARLTSTQFRIQKKHQWHVVGLQSPLVSIATSSVTSNEVIKHEHKPIYGFQGHPEVTTDDGRVVMENFLGMCGFADRFV